MKNYFSDKNIYFFSWFIFFLAGVFSIISIIFGKVDPYLYFNSDSLYLPTIYHGLFIEKLPFSSWKFPDAPFLFPDLIIYTLLETVLKDFRLTSLITSQIIYFSIFLVLFKIGETFLKKDSYISKSFILLFLSIFMFSISSNVFFLHTFILLTPVFHEGEILIATLLIFLVINYIKKDKAVHLLNIFIFTALITFADKSIVKDFVVPAFVLVPLFYFIKNENAWNSLKATGVIISGAIVGNLLYSTIISFPAENPSLTPFYKENLTFIWNDFMKFFSSSEIAIRVAKKEFIFFNYMGIFCLISIAAITIGLFIIKKLINENKTAFAFFTLFVLAQTMLNLIATVFFGYYRGLVHIRYFTTQMIFPIFWLICYLAIYFQKYLKKAVFLFTGIFFLVVLIFMKNIKNERNTRYFEYYPEDLECLKRAITENNLTSGIGEFWHIFPLRHFSNNTINLYQVVFDKKAVKPFHWLGSYVPYENLEFDYVLTKNLVVEDITLALGQADKVVNCKETNILIYKSNGNFKKETQALFNFDKFNNKGDSLEIYAVDFDNYIFDANVYIGELETVSKIENNKLMSNNKPGILSQGPALTLRNGKYRIEIFYSAKGNNVGAFELGTLNPKKVFNSKAFNTQGESDSISLDFEIDSTAENIYKASIIRLITHYYGNGELAVEKMKLTKL